MLRDWSNANLALFVFIFSRKATPKLFKIYPRANGLESLKKFHKLIQLYPNSFYA
jgi:hypothetical protein